jgi:hypothetical protein
LPQTISSAGQATARTSPVMPVSAMVRWAAIAAPTLAGPI